MFWERDLALFGWMLSVAMGFEAHPRFWSLLCQWFRQRRAEMPRCWLWWGSCAALTLCLGPVMVDVSIVRIGLGG